MLFAPRANCPHTSGEQSRAAGPVVRIADDRQLTCAFQGEEHLLVSVKEPRIRRRRNEKCWNGQASAIDPSDIGSAAAADRGPDNIRPLGGQCEHCRGRPVDPNEAESSLLERSTSAAVPR